MPFPHLNDEVKNKIRIRLHVIDLQEANAKKDKIIREQQNRILVNENSVKKQQQKSLLLENILDQEFNLNEQREERLKEDLHAMQRENGELNKNLKQKIDNCKKLQRLASKEKVENN